MSDTKYIYYWSDSSNWFYNQGFCIYTLSQIEDFIKKNKHVKFIQMGPETSFDDLSYKMYKIMENDIMQDDEYIANNDVRYSSHHRT